jgi:hypothetical protein
MPPKSAQSRFRGHFARVNPKNPHHQREQLLLLLAISVAES